MTLDQGLLFGLLLLTMALFVLGRWRYDLVALLALLAAVLIGLVPAESAFMGFGHPAVITVAAVLIISRALQVSGLVDQLVRLLGWADRSTTVQIGATGGLGLVFSAFMNNIGALALMLPVALRQAARSRRPASRILMPLSFATLLGGLITQIGTPPNIIIASFRGETSGTAFSLFDFALVGLPVALVGFAYLALIGWRLLPTGREEAPGTAEPHFAVTDYLIEARVPEGSTLKGARVRDLEQLCDNEATVMAIIRDDRRLLAPLGPDTIRIDDVLVLEGDPAALEPLFSSNRLAPTGQADFREEDLRSEQVSLLEAVVMPNAPIEGRSMRGLRIHEKYGVNLLAMARRDWAPRTRLGAVRFVTGDVLLLQGDSAKLHEVAVTLGCLPLAERALRIGRPRRSLQTLGIFAVALGLTAFGLLPIQVAFLLAVAALILGDCLTLREAYDAIEWPIIILLACLLPLGGALETTGATALLGQGVVGLAGDLPLWATLALVTAISMLLSDLVHNSPTAVLMAPLALEIARGLGAPPDAFLMAVAIGAASPYLTPIGHQSNTLVMAPGGYRFSDYWRMGLPLDGLILLVSTPMLLWIWAS